MLFSLRSLARADNPDLILDRLRETNQQKLGRGRVTDDDFASLVGGVRWIIENPSPTDLRTQKRARQSLPRAAADSIELCFGPIRILATLAPISRIGEITLTQNARAADMVLMRFLSRQQGGMLHPQSIQ